MIKFGSYEWTPGELAQREQDYALLNSQLDEAVDATIGVIADGRPDAIAVHDMHLAHGQLEDWHVSALFATALMRLARSPYRAELEQYRREIAAIRDQLLVGHDDSGTFTVGELRALFRDGPGYPTEEK